MTRVALILGALARATVLAVLVALARILHITIVPTITNLAATAIAAMQILALAVTAVSQRILTLVDVDRTVDVSVASAGAVARERVDAVVTLAVVLAGHVAVKIRCAVVDVRLAVETREAQRTRALWRLLI